jgi:hypothetical protein
LRRSLANFLFLFPPLMKFAFRLFCLVCAAGFLCAKEPGDFPRLLGMNIGKKIYDDPAYQARLARLDVVILGFPPDWDQTHPAMPISRVLANLKRMNPAIKIGQYTILNETYDHRASLHPDIHAEVEKNNWWLRNAQGGQVQWTTKYGTYEIDIGPGAKPNEKGQHYQEWLAARNNRVFFKDHPEFDIWYCDNVMQHSRVTADWDHDGHDDNPTDPRIQAMFRSGMARYWTALRALQPGLILMGNTDGDLSQPEYRKKLDAAFMEHWMGRKYSVEARHGWAAAIALYRTTRSNLPDGAILGIGIGGAVDDYRFFRYGFTSCLMDDGYFCYTDEAAGYSSVVLFDEYDIPLGRATTPPPRAPWQNGVWRRDFAGGVALVNPTAAPATVTLEAGLRKFAGRQAPDINDGQPVTELTLPARDGIVLVREPKR